MSQPQVGYQPIGAIVEVLDALRTANRAWIADEVEAAIREGRRVPQGAVPRGAGDHWTSDDAGSAPFSEDEQLRLAIRAVQHYVLEVHDTWRWLQEQWAALPGLEGTTFSIAYAESSEPLSPLDPLFVRSDDHLAGLLRELWPDGPGSYDDALRKLGRHQ